jgi:hypothetical protein
VIVAARLMSKRAGEPRLSNPGRSHDILPRNSGSMF